MRRTLLMVCIVVMIAITGCDSTGTEHSEVSPQEKKSAEEKNETIKEKTEAIEEKNASEKKQGTSTEAPEEKISVDFINKGAWEITYREEVSPVEYQLPEFSPKKKEYPFKLEQVVNKNQFSGFTPTQKKMLEKNGFVVLKPGRQYFSKMHHGYEFAEYDNIPTFITTDAVLNMYHIFYSESLKLMEIKTCAKRLRRMTESLLTKALKAYESSDEEDRKILKEVAAYYAVGARVLGDKRKLPEAVETLTAVELKRIDEKPKERIKSSILGSKVDYSQFIVRGHYTIDEAFESYFKAMMWFSNGEFQLTRVEGEKEIINEEALNKSLMVTLLLMAEGKSDLEDYLTIYDMTRLYSGDSDDLNILDLVKVIEKVYGKAPELESIFEKKLYEQLKAEVLQMRIPKIVPKIEKERTQGKNFRLMGQRYTLDAELLQRLVKPYKRPFPTAFDILAAFDNESAEKILYKYYETNQRWPAYDEKLKEAKLYVKSLPQNFWQKDLYHGWLWAIVAAAKSYSSADQMPLFMTTEAWHHKSLSSALGSYTELKHDNILYAKQAMAEMGGPMEWSKEYHYVEPNVELYSRLLWLTKYTKANYEKRISNDEKSIEMLAHMIEMLEVLQHTSVKEVEGISLTEEELTQLSTIGGLIDYINYSSLNQLWEHIPGVSDEEFSALVADIYTNIDRKYLEEGIGMPFEIYVLCPINGNIFLTRGTVYSYYEFISSERLTTEKWHEMIGIEVSNQTEDFTVRHYEGEKKDILEMMPWMRSYIAPTPSTVKHQRIEVDWMKKDE